jgi:hypothetical protein
MSHAVWSTKEGRRVAALGKLLKWPTIGALIAGGALVTVRVFGPDTAQLVGRRGGEAFAEGVAAVQNQIANNRSSSGRGSRWG